MGKIINYKDKLIRFHVLANSDSEEDQKLKLKVRDEIIKYLQPLLKKSRSIEESEKIILSENENIKRISKNIILEFSLFNLISVLYPDKNIKNINPSW